MQTCNSILAAFLLPAIGIAGVCSNTSLGNGMTCIQSAKCGSAGNSSTLTCSFGSTPTVNNFIIVTIGNNNSLNTLSASDNQGNSYHKDSSVNGGNTLGNVISSAVAATSSGTFTVTTGTGGPSSTWNMRIYEISGMATSSVNDATGTANVNVSSTSSTVTTSGTPTQAKELIFSSVSFLLTGTNTAGSGYTLLENDTGACGNGCMTDEAKTVTNANSGTQTATVTFGATQTMGYEAGINTYKAFVLSGFSKAKKLLKYESY